MSFPAHCQPEYAPSSTLQLARVALANSPPIWEDIHIVPSEFTTQIAQILLALNSSNLLRRCCWTPLFLVSPRCIVGCAATDCCTSQDLGNKAVRLNAETSCGTLNIVACSHIYIDCPLPQLWDTSGMVRPPWYTLM